MTQPTDQKRESARLCRDVAMLWRLTDEMLVPGPARRDSLHPPISVGTVPVDVGVMDARRAVEGLLLAVWRFLYEKPPVDVPGLVTAILRVVQVSSADDVRLTEVNDHLMRVCSRLRRALSWSAHLQVLGTCPLTISGEEPVAWDRAGDPIATVAEDRPCLAYAVEVSEAATRAAGRPVDVWVPSPIVVDPEADPLTPAGDIRCLGCHHRWSAGERVRLSKLLERASA